MLTISVAYGMLLTARAGSYKKEELTMLHLNRQSLKENRAEWDIMGPLSRPRSKILRVAVSRIILSSEASKVKLVGNLVA